MEEHLSSLLPATEENRRRFLVTKLAAGFAMAVCPITAETITTDTNGLDAGELKIPTADGGEMPGYWAMPSKGKSFPVVLVVEEIFGVHEHIKDLCRRLAKSGYLAIAPELFTRQGDVSKIENEKATPTLSSLERLARALEVGVPDLLTGGERNRQEEIRDLVKDPFIAEMLPFINQLNGMQMSSILTQVRDLTMHPRRSA